MIVLSQYIADKKRRLSTENKNEINPKRGAKAGNDNTVICQFL
jgi:hypothetical protein